MHPHHPSRPVDPGNERGMEGGGVGVIIVWPTCLSSGYYVLRLLLLTHTSQTWIAEMAHLKKGEHDQVLFDRLIFSNAEVIPSRSDHLFR